MDAISQTTFPSALSWMKTFKNPIKISPKFVPKSAINNIPPPIQIMAWRRPADEPLSEPMMVSLPTHQVKVTTSTWGGHADQVPDLLHGILTIFFTSLRWRHNDHDGGSNHQPHGCLLNRLFRRKSKKTAKLRVTVLCVGNSPRPVNSPHKGPVTRKMFPFDDVIMFLVSQLVIPEDLIYCWSKRPCLSRICNSEAIGMKWDVKPRWRELPFYLGFTKMPTITPEFEHRQLVNIITSSDFCSSTTELRVSIMKLGTFINCKKKRRVITESHNSIMGPHKSGGIQKDPRYIMELHNYNIWTSHSHSLEWGGSW